MTGITVKEIGEREAVISYTTVASTSVVDEVVRLLSATVAPGTAAQAEPRQRSIMELQGLGRDIWQGIDVGKYIDELRDEWDHR